ncbi:MAG: SRPBCC family protein [Bacteroidia bacterium]
MKTVDVTTEIIINCHIDTVAEFASNPDNVTKWYVNIKSVEWKTPKPLQLGSQMAFKAQFLGNKLAYIYEVVENIPNKKFVMRTADGPFPMETTYAWESIDSKTTKMTLRNAGNPSGFSKLFAPFMASMMRKANQKDLVMLKNVLELKTN